MKLILLLSASLLLAFVSSSPTEKVAKDNTEFAFKLYSSLDKKGKNIFLSPYSISSALAMTYAGARTTTAGEISEVMHFSGSRGAFHGGFNQLMTEIGSRNGEDVEMRIANRIFGAKGYRFRDSFLDELKDWYNAPLEQLDFAGETEKSRQRINRWVEDQTKNKIQDLIPEGVLSDMTAMVLANAIYFYGDWQSQFDSSRTGKGDFYAGGNKKITTDLMSQTANFQYMENEQFQAVRLPYKGNTLSMEIFLPKQKDGLEALEKSLDNKSYSEWQKQFKDESVHLMLPKFRMTSDFMLVEILKKMGMKFSFTPGAADFSGMTGKKDLFVSAVIHKAFIDVSEKGTEAAAATAVVFTFTCMEAPPTPKLFQADHPFFFLIRDNSTGSVLFMGRLNTPE